MRHAGRSEPDAVAPRVLGMEDGGERTADPPSAGRPDAALRVLRERYAGPLWRFAVSLIGEAEADDVVQETLIRAWRTPGILAEPPERTGAWLFTVARRLVIDRTRSARSRYERPKGELPEHPVADRAEEVLDAILLQDALAQLSERHRTVIVRAYYGASNTAELAVELGIAEGTVKSRLHYGLRALRSALQERGVSR